MTAAWSAISMSIDQKSSHMSREGDVMVLCDGAHDLPLCIVQSEESCEKKWLKNARIPALGYGSVQEEEES